MLNITPYVGMDEWKGSAALRSKKFRNHLSHGLKFLSMSPWWTISQVMQVGDGKDNHTCVHCSEVGFIVLLISGTFQVDFTHVSAS